ncbi:hypothetical protein ACJIZ3_018968 [Penstemon smallii]|uniref:UspA domain-containing protein n=1 Tax=Penstemon smallii TaxID=265156 RepID=A0ABD3SZU3_9LAMI
MEGSTTETTTGLGTVAAPPPEFEKSTSMHVLLAIDDSDESFNALQWLLDNILKRPHTGEMDDYRVVTIVHVVEPLPHYAFPGGYDTYPVMESTNKSQEQNAARILSKAYEMCREKSVKAKTLVLEGDPKDKICQTVEEMNIDLLVVGSRGLGQIKRAFLGSVSDYCAHHAKCPVLVVKPPIKKTH